MAKLAQEGRTRSRRSSIEGRTIATTFWGKALVRQPRALQRLREPPAARPHLRAQRLGGRPADRAGRGDGAGQRLATLYTVAVEGRARAAGRAGRAICADCAGGIDSLVELLQGRFSKGVMERICAAGDRACSPRPPRSEFSCSCPDWAAMCKHVAAVLYGVGARLDDQPELLFQLRGVDEQELIARAGKDLRSSRKGPAAGRVLAEEGLSELFGIDLAEAPAAPKPRPAGPAAEAGPRQGPGPRPKPRPAGGAGSRGARRR